jgi:hypothetical protein
MIVDSQAVKNTCNASIESKGFSDKRVKKDLSRYREQNQV